jgi:exosortase family protein XrtM
MLFLVIFISLMTLHYYTRFYTAYFVITKLNAGVSSSLINLITPAEQTEVEGQILKSGSFMIAVARGCDGIDGILLITSALLAFPLAWKKKTLGIVLGILLLYGANLIRIISLYYVTKYRPGAFDFAHIYLWQTITIFIGVIFFAWWTKPEARKQEG